jgi:acylphosphatase
MSDPHTDAPPTCWRLRAFGRVQGVGYRVDCADEARRLGLAGWVRNRRDGSVEVLAQGDAAGLERLRAWMQRGPSAARVERVDATPVGAPQPPEPPDPPLGPGFELRPTE